MRRSIQILLGLTLSIAAGVLFIMSITATIHIPPSATMESVILAMALIGIYFGISNGKNLAYHIHDRELYLEISRGNGTITSMAGSMMRFPIFLASMTLILWSLGLIAMGFFWSALSDSLFLGEVRWMLILSMAILISGSFILFGAVGHGKDRMLTRKGKMLLKGHVWTVGGAMNMMDTVEDAGKGIVKEGMEKVQKIF
jgi:hypothetical protein